MMSPRWRKAGLTLHVVCSVASLGAVAAFLALAVVGLRGGDEAVMRAAYMAMEPIAWFVIVPLLFASLFSGLVQSLGTSWGLFRYYWILAKLALTVFTVAVLLAQMPSIGEMAGLAAQAMTSDTDALGARQSFQLHAAGGLFVLLVLVVISIYKPRGMTRFGWRRLYGR